MSITVFSSHAMTIVEKITEGVYDEHLDSIALAVMDRRKQLRRQREPQSVRDLMALVRKHPGSTAPELAEMMGVSRARIYQIANLAERHDQLKPVERGIGSYGKRFWPKDSAA